jgi:hypothetical protein
MSCTLIGTLIGSLIGFFPQFFAVITFITPILAGTTVVLFMDKFPETYTTTFTLASLALATDLCIIANLTQLMLRIPTPVHQHLTIRIA